MESSVQARVRLTPVDAYFTVQYMGKEYFEKWKRMENKTVQSNTRWHTFMHFIIGRFFRGLDTVLATYMYVHCAIVSYKRTLRSTCI